MNKTVILSYCCMLLFLFIGCSNNRFFYHDRYSPYYKRLPVSQSSNKKDLFHISNILQNEIDINKHCKDIFSPNKTVKQLDLKKLEDIIYYYNNLSKTQLINLKTPSLISKYRIDKHDTFEIYSEKISIRNIIKNSLINRIDEIGIYSEEAIPFLISLLKDKKNKEKAKKAIFNIGSSAISILNNKFEQMSKNQNINDITLQYDILDLLFRFGYASENYYSKIITNKKEKNPLFFNNFTKYIKKQSKYNNKHSNNKLFFLDIVKHKDYKIREAFFEYIVKNKNAKGNDILALIPIIKNIIGNNEHTIELFQIFQILDIKYRDNQIDIVKKIIVPEIQRSLTFFFYDFKKNIALTSILLYLGYKSKYFDNDLKKTIEYINIHYKKYNNKDLTKFQELVIFIQRFQKISDIIINYDSTRSTKYDIDYNKWFEKLMKSVHEIDDESVEHLICEYPYYAYVCNRNILKQFLIDQNDGCLLFSKMITYYLYGFTFPSKVTYKTVCALTCTKFLDRYEKHGDISAMLYEMTYEFSRRANSNPVYGIYLFKNLHNYNVRTIFDLIFDKAYLKQNIDTTINLAYDNVNTFRSNQEILFYKIKLLSLYFEKESLLVKGLSDLSSVILAIISFIDFLDKKDVDISYSVNEIEELFKYAFAFYNNHKILNKEHIELLIRLFLTMNNFYLKNNNYKMASVCAYKAIAIYYFMENSKLLNNIELESYKKQIYARIYIAQGDYYFNNKKYDQAILNYNQSLKYKFEKIKMSAVFIGSFYYGQGKFINSINWSDIRFKICLCLFYKNKYQDCIETVLNIREERFNDSHHMLSFIQNIDSYLLNYSNEEYKNLLLSAYLRLSYDKQVVYKKYIFNLLMTFELIEIEVSNKLYNKNIVLNQIKNKHDKYLKKISNLELMIHLKDNTAYYNELNNIKSKLNHLTRIDGKNIARTTNTIYQVSSKYLDNNYSYFNKDNFDPQTMYLCFKQFNDLSDKNEYIMAFYIIKIDNKLNYYSNVITKVKSLDKLIKKLDNCSKDKDDSTKLKLLTEFFTLFFNKNILKGEKYSNVKNLVIIPSGIINYLPFDIFYHNNKYLIEDYHIYYRHSLLNEINKTDFDHYKIVLHEEDSIINKNALNQNKREVVLIGNPNFSYPFNLESIQICDYKFGSLNETKEEINRISKLLSPEFTVTKFLGDSAKEDIFYSFYSPKIIHVATHGYHFSDNKFTKTNSILSRCGIVLSHINAFSNINPMLETDGFLSAREISGLQLEHTELFVLSACLTMKGEISDNNEIAGIRLGLLFSGVNNAMLTLSNIGDRNTKSFMISFYKNFINNKHKGYNYALRKTKLDLINHGHPINDWYPYILYNLN